jgi:RNA polymerase sigma factor (sigma-70 family)
MRRTAVHTMISRLALASAVPGGGDTSDAQLLCRFAVERDEAAFALVVRRHGPMVLDVCRAVLGNHADAEDALQATFLLLARKAAVIRQPGSLAAWLHAVAYRTACKARAYATRRRAHEAQVPVRPPSAPDDLSWGEVREAVHDALARLTERYQAPLVLCYLRGLTQDQAANALGLSRAALKKRLERGRAKLRAALARRGLGATSMLTVAALPAAPALPPALAQTVAEVAPRFVSGSADAAGAIPASVLRLVRGRSMAMLTAKLSLLLLLPIALGVTVLGGNPPPATAVAQEAVPQEAPRNPPERPQTPADREARALAGTWKLRHIETRGEPLLNPDQLANARVTFTDGRAKVAGFQVSFIRDFAFRIDPVKSPKEIDVTFLEGPMEDRAFQGIYVIRKDEVRICLRLKTIERGRPRGFVTNGGDTLYTLILDRAEHSR